MLLHDQNEWPEIENLGMDVTPGYNTNIRIQRSKVIIESWDGTVVTAFVSHQYGPRFITHLTPCVDWVCCWFFCEGFSPGSDSGHSKFVSLFLEKKKIPIPVSTFPSRSRSLE